MNLPRPPPAWMCFAAGTMTGFAAAHPGHGRIFKRQTRMRAGGKDARNIGVTFVTRFIADEGAPSIVGGGH